MNKKVYAGNLSFDTTQERLSETFSKYGELEDVKLITDYNTGRSKGFAFLTFKDEESAKACVADNGLELDGRNLRLDIAQDKPQRKERF